jgi:hypothetical protein
MLNKFKNFIVNWGHYGFLGLAISHYISGDTGMVSTMLLLFAIEEISSPRYDIRK